MTTIASKAEVNHSLLHTLETVRSGLMVASVIPAIVAVSTLPRAMPAHMPNIMPMASLSMHATAAPGGMSTRALATSGMRTGTVQYIRGPSVAVMRSVHNIAVCIAAFAAFATAAVEVLRGVILHGTATADQQKTTNLPRSFITHQQQQAGSTAAQEEELRMLENVLAKLEGALGALPEPLHAAATSAAAAHAADTLCKPGMPLYMMDTMPPAATAMLPSHKVSHTDVPLPPHAEVWAEDEEDEQHDDGDDDDDDTPFSSGPRNGTFHRVHPAPSYMHARILSPRASAPAALASVTHQPSTQAPLFSVAHQPSTQAPLFSVAHQPSTQAPVFSVAHQPSTPPVGLAGLTPLLRATSAPATDMLLGTSANGQHHAAGLSNGAAGNNAAAGNGAVAGLSNGAAVHGAAVDAAQVAAAVDAELVQTAVRTMQALHAAALEEDRVSPRYLSQQEVSVGGAHRGPELTQHLSRMARKWWLYQQQREAGATVVAA